MGGNVLSGNVLGPGISAVLTTAGDLLYVNAAGELTRLPIGSAGEVLTVVSSLPDWEAPGKVVIPITGWVEDTGWTYASATTFTKVGDFTAIFRKGTKLRYKQGAGYKYAYLTLSALAAGVTTITCTGGSDYSLAVGAITDAAYSHIENPEGFPDWFTYAPAIVGYSANPGSTDYRFKVIGRACTVSLFEAVNGTSNSTLMTYGLPITPSATIQVPIPTPVDAGSGVPNGVGQVFSGTAVLYCYRQEFAAWTNSGLKRLAGTQFTYAI